MESVRKRKRGRGRGRESDVGGRKEQVLTNVHTLRDTRYDKGAGVPFRKRLKESGIDLRILGIDVGGGTVANKRC